MGKLKIQKVTWNLFQDPLVANSDNMIADDSKSFASVKTVKKLQGKKINGKFFTFAELDEQRRLKKLEASDLMSRATEVDIVGLKENKHHGNFGGVFRTRTQQQLEQELNSDEMGSQFIKMIAENKVRMIFPMATQEELVALDRHEALPKFSLLR
jgi:hypothetical protein